MIHIWYKKKIKKKNNKKNKVYIKNTKCEKKKKTAKK